MAKALSSRRRKAADEWAEPPSEERQTLANSAARADTIRAAVRYVADKQAEIKALREDLNEYKQKHIKGDLGFKIADFNAVLRVSQLEVEDRDKLLDTLGEGFQALGIGGQLDWVAAERGEPQPDGAAAPRRRGKAQPVNPRTDNPDAYQQGAADGAAGHRDHAARSNGEIGAAAYELGHAAGERKRQVAEGNGAEPAAKRGRGRPRKPAEQPELSIVEGTGGDAAAE